MTYEEMIEDITYVDPCLEAIEAAEDAMAFVLTLHSMFKECGAPLGDEPDTSELEAVIDSLHGELVAAALFLSEDSMTAVPAMLRGVAKGFEQLDLPYTDPAGEKAPSVPSVIKNGFERLANRIEAARTHKAHFTDLLNRAEFVKPQE
jgi:hypothetical protein